jgi:hypothetical protein
MKNVMIEILLIMMFVQIIVQRGQLDYLEKNLFVEIENNKLQIIFDLMKNVMIEIQIMMILTNQ